jgi:hypothetical protein
MVKKKQKYTLPEHEQHHNRVDIFRSTFQAPSAPSVEHLEAVEASIDQLASKYLASYTNDSYVSSTNHLNHLNQMNFVSETTNVTDSTSNLSLSSKKPNNQNIWLTGSSMYLPTIGADSIYHNRHNQRSVFDDSSTQTKVKCGADRHKRRCMYIVAGVLVVVVLVAVAMALAIYFLSNSTFNSNSKECLSECVDNR